MCKTKAKRWHIAATNPLLRVPLRAAPPTLAVERTRRLVRLVRLVHGQAPRYDEGVLSLVVYADEEDLSDRRDELDALLEEEKGPGSWEFARWYRAEQRLGAWRVERRTSQPEKGLHWGKLEWASVSLADPEWSVEEVLDLFDVELATLLARRDRSEEFEELFAAFEGYFRQEEELARTWLNDGKEDEAKQDINLHATSVLQHRKTATRDKVSAWMLRRLSPTSDENLAGLLDSTGRVCFTALAENAAMVFDLYVGDDHKIPEWVYELPVDLRAAS